MLATDDMEHSFPVRRAVLGLGVMIFIFLLSSYFRWQASDDALSDAIRQTEVLVETERLQQLIDRRTAAAQRVIYSEDGEAEFRYDEVRREHGRTRVRLETLLNHSTSHEILERIDRGESAIFELEQTAFNDARVNGVNAGLRLLEEGGHRSLIDAAVRDVTQLEDLFVTGLEDTRRSQRFLQLSDKVFVVLLSAIMAGAAWFLVLRPAQAWGRRLEAANAALAKADLEKSQFLSTMSHEIRTPLNSIIGFSDLLASDPELDPPKRRQVELINNAGGALLSVVNDILDISKLEAGKVVLHPTVFSLHSLVDNTVSIVRGQADRKGIEMSVDIGSEAAHHYFGSDHRIRQILLNLLNNAIKFTVEGTVALSVEAWPEGGKDRLRFEVTDSGRGIDPDKIKSMFQSFVQVHDPREQWFGGTGLGLAISRQLVELMGGTIGVESRRGDGSTFWFEIPLPRGDRKQLPSLDDSCQVEDGPSCHILLVEDLLPNQELASVMLQRMGHRVDVANDGHEAIEAVRRTQYDLVLMDMQMPGIDGITTLRRIREMGGEFAALKVVAMTANALPEQVRQYRAEGFAGFIAKPFRESELREGVNGALQAAPGHLENEGNGQSQSNFDPATFQELAAVLPKERLADYLSRLEARAGGLCDSSEGDGMLAQEAHKLVNEAGMLGFVRLSLAARDLQHAAEAGRSVEETWDEVRGATADAMPLIRQLCARLDN